MALSFGCFLSPETILSAAFFSLRATELFHECFGLKGLLEKFLLLIMFEPTDDLVLQVSSILLKDDLMDMLEVSCNIDSSYLSVPSEGESPSM